MSIVLSEAKHRLRYGHRGGADGARQLLGVVIEDRIPGDSPIWVHIDRPTVFAQSDPGQRDGAYAGSAGQGYIVEHAPRPLVTSAGGVQFRKRIPTLSVLPGAPSVGSNFIEVGNQPAWATVAGSLANMTGTLIAKGREQHHRQQWYVDANGSVPNSGHRPAGELLRVRWSGTAEAGETIDGGGNAGFTFRLQTTGPAGDASDIAPGSVEITATIGGNALVIRDDGAGRLYGWEATGGTYATGAIDYRTATVTLVFSTATDAVAVTADYEHSCLYLPIDIHLMWDAEMAQG